MVKYSLSPVYWMDQEPNRDDDVSPDAYTNVLFARTRVESYTEMGKVAWVRHLFTVGS